MTPASEQERDRERLEGEVLSVAHRHDTEWDVRALARYVLSLAERVERMEAWAHEPFDFGYLIDRLSRVETSVERMESERRLAEDEDPRKQAARVAEEMRELASAPSGQPVAPPTFTGDGNPLARSPAFVAGEGQPEGAEQEREWLKATCDKLDGMGYVVVSRREWEEVVPRFAAAFPDATCRSPAQPLPVPTGGEQERDLVEAIVGALSDAYTDGVAFQRDGTLHSFAWHHRAEEIARAALLKALRSGPVPTGQHELRKALADIKYFAEGHHGEQPRNELLHSLTVDIPHMVDVSLEATGDPEEAARRNAERLPDGRLDMAREIVVWADPDDLADTREGQRATVHGKRPMPSAEDEFRQYRLVPVGPVPTGEQPSRSWDGMSPLAASPAAEQEEREPGNVRFMCLGCEGWFSENEVTTPSGNYHCGNVLEFPLRSVSYVQALQDRLFALRSAPSGTRQREELANRLERAWEFLCGAEPDEHGFWFGDGGRDEHGRRAPFAWRSKYRALVADVLAALRAVPSESQQEPDAEHMRAVVFSCMDWGRLSNDMRNLYRSPVPADQEPRK